MDDDVEGQMHIKTSFTRERGDEIMTTSESRLTVSYMFYTPITDFGAWRVAIRSATSTQHKRNPSEQKMNLVSGKLFTTQGVKKYDVI